jgi:hypothetical protein
VQIIVTKKERKLTIRSMEDEILENIVVIDIYLCDTCDFNNCLEMINIEFPLAIVLEAYESYQETGKAMFRIKLHKDNLDRLLDQPFVDEADDLPF